MDVNINQITNILQNTQIKTRLTQFVLNDIDYMVESYCKDLNLEFSTFTDLHFSFDMNMDDQYIFHLDKNSYDEMTMVFKEKLLARNVEFDELIVQSYLDIYCEFLENGS
jgi:hypothetical protein